MSGRLKGKRHGGRHRKAHSANDLNTVGEPPRRNLSTSMLLTDLRDGMFIAEIPLDVVSSNGDVTVRVTDSCLELFVLDDGLGVPEGGNGNGNGKQQQQQQQQHGGGSTGSVGTAAGPATSDSAHQSPATHSPSSSRSTSRRRLSLQYRGTIDLPIYVDAQRLQFELDEDGRTLRVEGGMKGCRSVTAPSPVAPSGHHHHHQGTAAHELEHGAVHSLSTCDLRRTSGGDPVVDVSRSAAAQRRRSDACSSSTSPSRRAACPHPAPLHQLQQQQSTGLMPQSSDSNGRLGVMGSSAINSKSWPNLRV